jgi:hypothetical protein
MTAIAPTTYVVVVSANHLRHHTYEVQAFDDSAAESAALDQFTADYPAAEVDNVVIQTEGDG